MVPGRVSVVIPTYMGEMRLPALMEMLWAQTYQDVEAIIIDDASTDNSWKVICELKEQFPEIICVRLNKNSGAANARNVGINEASGEFVAFMDDDDVWYPNKIARQVRLLESSDRIGLVGCGIRQVFPKLKLSYRSIGPVELTFNELLIENVLGGTATVLARTEAIRATGGFDCNFAAREEYDLWLRVSQNWRVSRVDEMLMDVIHDLDRATRVSNSFNRYVNSCRQLNEKWAGHVANLSSEAQKRRQAEQSFFLGAQATKAGSRWNALFWYWRSLRHCATKKALVGVMMAPFGYVALLRIRGLVARAT